MYRTLLATCGSENFRGLYSIKLRIFGFHFRGATRCKQRAVHCLSMKIYLSSYHFGEVMPNGERAIGGFYRLVLLEGCVLFLSGGFCGSCTVGAEFVQKK